MLNTATQSHNDKGHVFSHMGTSKGRFFANEKRTSGKREREDKERLMAVKYSQSTW